MESPNIQHILSNFHNICRLCLKKDNLVNIFEINKKTKLASLGPIVRETMEMMSLSIHFDDGLSQCICVSCKNMLRNMYRFKNQCNESIDLLHELISQVQPSTEVKILHDGARNKNKTEPSEEYEEQSILEESLLQESDFKNTELLLEISAPKFEEIDVAECSNQEVPDSSNNYVEFLEEETQNQTEAANDEFENDNDDDPDLELALQQIEDSSNCHDTKDFLNFPENKINTKAEQECPICHKIVRFYKPHLKTHSNERSFRCTVPECDKAFRTSSKLKLHYDGVHLNKRNHICPICLKAFKIASNLRNHLLTHTDERKFVCDYVGCGKSFQLAGTLRVHQKIHYQEKNHQCEVCGKAFLLKYRLLKHERIHTGERPYKCQCGKAYITSTNLKAHKKTHEKGEMK